MKDCINCLYNTSWTKKDLDEGKLKICLTCKDQSNWKSNEALKKIERLEKPKPSKFVEPRFREGKFGG